MPAELLWLLSLSLEKPPENVYTSGKGKS